MSRPVRAQGHSTSMPGYAGLIGRVGALAVFLGVGSAFAIPGVALAEAETAGSSTASSNEDSASASADVDESTTANVDGSTTDANASSTTSTFESATESRSGVVQASGGANTSVKNGGDESSGLSETDGDFAEEEEVIPGATDEEQETVHPTAAEDASPASDTTDSAAPTGNDSAADAQDAVTPTRDRAAASTPADSTRVRATEISTTSSSSVVQKVSSAVPTVGGDDGESTEVTLQSHVTVPGSEQDVSTLAAATTVPATTHILAAPATFLTGLVSTLLGANPLVTNGPVAPPESPTLWALLGWVRRQIEYTFFNSTPSANYDPAQNSQTFNGVILGKIAATDADGDRLTYTVTEGPQHGTVVVDSSGSFSYIPTEEMAATGGTDTFTISVDDRPGNPFHFHGLATFFEPNGGATAEAVVTVTVDPASAIGTEGQVRLEQLAQQIANDPDVQALRQAMREHWLTVAGQKYAAIGGIDDESLTRLEQALDEFILGAAMRVVNTDPTRPEVLTIALPEHDWYGTSVSGGRWFYDNPDSVYRVIPVAADSSYVITGRYVGDRPLDGNLSVYTDNSVFAPVSNLAFKDVEIAPDGTFTITVDSTPPNGRVNHIQLMAGANQIVVRETLGAWTENAAYLEVTRLDGPQPGPVKTYDDLVDDAVALLINDAITMYRAETDPAIFQPANVLLPPITLPGTLIGQRQSWGHFDLEDNEALVVTIKPGDAGYFTIPVTDIWMKSPNFWDHQSSLNSEQAIANDDGTYTIVVSKSDPGVANWVDTVGLEVGTLLVRWQQPGAHPAGGEPMVSAAVVSLDDLDSVLPAETVWVTPEERQHQLDARKEAFNQRFSPFEQA